MYGGKCELVYGHEAASQSLATAPYGNRDLSLFLCGGHADGKREWDLSSSFKSNIVFRVLDHIE